MGLTTSNTSDGMPKYFSYDSTKNIIADLNSLFKQNSNQLAFLLQLKNSELQYNGIDWKKSLVPGTLTTSNSIHKNLKNIYKSHEAMKHFQKALSQSITPSGPAPQFSEQQCCVCLDKMATMMLPCYHTFCPNCTQTHIIDQQQKKCPICRAEFHEDNNSLQSKIITVVGNEQPLIKDVREMILGYLKELNKHVIKQIENQIRIKECKPEIGSMAQRYQ